ncbi:hypothetical protein JCM11251_003116 [Rhodosporidiobolus azoricus]
MPSRRSPPDLTVRIPGKAVQHACHASIPAFGISSFSHRILRSHPVQDSLEQAQCNVSDLDDESAMEDAAVALAQVGLRPPSRLLVHHQGGQGQTSTLRRLSHTTIPITVDVHPPTPNPSSLPTSAAPSPATRRRSSSAEAHVRAIKQSRRVASIYSISSSTGGKIGERDSWYLRPDLSGASSLTLDQLPRTVSLENLTIHSVAPSGVSTTGAVETLNSASRPTHSRQSSFSSLCSTASPSSPVSTGAPSIADSRLDLTTHAAPPAAQPQREQQYTTSLPPCTTRPRRFSRPSRPGASAACETEGDRLKRLYLCTWEGTSPKPPASGEEAVSRSRSVRSRVIGVGASLHGPTSDPEKSAAWAEKDVEAAAGVMEEQVPSRAERHRKRLLINLLLILLGALVFADLLAMNVRVFAGRDAYLSE